jgi:ribonuclease HII
MPTGQSTSPSSQFSAASILSKVLPEWEIDETTHIPIYMTKCKDCFQFTTHIASQTQGGALEILNGKQRLHWHKVLEKEMREMKNESKQLEARENKKRWNV